MDGIRSQTRHCIATTPMTFDSLTVAPPGRLLHSLPFAIGSMPPKIADRGSLHAQGISHNLLVTARSKLVILQHEDGIERRIPRSMSVCHATMCISPIAP